MIRAVFVASITAVFVVMASIESRADWQYTRWGMTPDQVLAASKGQLRRCDPLACKGQTSDTEAAQLFGDYQSGKFTFTAFIFFDKRSSKLSHVNIQLKTPEKANELIGALRAKYGEPSSRNVTAIMTLLVWRDQKDQISIMIIGSGPSAQASVYYQPRATDSNKGL